jgi:hypothetical protein
MLLFKLNEASLQAVFVEGGEADGMKIHFVTQAGQSLQPHHAF